MKINNLRKIEYISIIVLVIMMISNVFVAYADQKSDLKNQQNNIDGKIKEINSEINEVKTQMSEAQRQITNYNSQISTYEGEIYDLETQISTLQTQITEKEANIKEQQKKFEEQQELLEKRLVAMYESGTTSYLDMLLSSNGLADFISKYYLIEQLAEFDTELLNGIEATRVQIENEKNDLQTAKNQVESSKTQAEVKRNSLTVLVNEKNSLVGSLSAEEKELQQQLEEFEQDKKDIQRELAKIAQQEEAERRAKQQASGGKVVPSAPSTAGFICPLSGKSRGSITTGYGKYQTLSGQHTGVDWACSAGTPIMAAKSGKVVISTALRRPNGSYKSYGEYIVISHGDGTMTLYAHMLSGTRAVQEGDQVSQGQVIGKVGSTGNSTGNHLHFEVRVNGKCVNPTPYLP